MSGMTSEQLEEYKQLKDEGKQKGERALQITMGALIAIGYIWMFSLTNANSTDAAAYAALVPGFGALVVMYWTKQLEFSGHRIAKYIREELENVVWPGESMRGWERWANNQRLRYHPTLGSLLFKGWKIDRVHLMFAPIPGILLFVSWHVLPEAVKKQPYNVAIIVGFTLAVYLAYGRLAYMMQKNIKEVR